MPSSIQKILNSDKFQDLVSKINEVIDYCDGSLTQSIKNAFKLINTNSKEIKLLNEQLNGKITDELIKTKFKEEIGGLYEEIRNTYVTPEMFGAVGDGVTDDSEAIQKAFNRGVPIHFGSKTYLCKDIITKNIKNIHMVGTGKTRIKWNITKTEESDRDFTGMISDDNYKNVSYNSGGDILIEDIIFDGNGPNITSFGKVNSAFGLCVFYNRDNVIVRNCTFENCHADGLNIQGLRNRLRVEGTTFRNIGLYQDKDGTRNGITVRRDYWDRNTSNNYGGNTIVNPGSIFVDVTNCAFEEIADECIRADGISCLTVNNCTMNNIGHYILETGHKTDRTKYVHTLSNCVGNNVGSGLYTIGADGGVDVYEYEGKVKITDCHFTNLDWTGCTAALRRRGQSVLVSAYAYQSEIQPEVFIENSIIKSSDTYPESKIDAHFLGGSSIYLKNTELYFRRINALGVFTFTDKMIVEDCDITIGGIDGVDYYVQLFGNTKVSFKHTKLNLNYFYHFIRSEEQNVIVIFEDCIIKHNDSSDIFIAFLGNQEGANIKITDNVLTGKLKGRFIHAADEGVIKVNMLNIANNLFPYQYNGWGSISNLTARYKVISGNFNYEN